MATASPNNIHQGYGAARIVYCPHDRFPRGNLVRWTDFRMDRVNHGEPSTLHDGVWPLGMVIEYKGDLYAVCGDGRFWREQQKKGYPLNIVYPPQELRKLNGTHYTRKTFTIGQNVHDVRNSSQGTAHRSGNGKAA